MELKNIGDACEPIIFNFHGYPWLIHRLTYRRTNHKNLHVRGYKEKGNINTPLDLAVQNQIDRFSLAIDVIDRVPTLEVAGARPDSRSAHRVLAIEWGYRRDGLANTLVLLIYRSLSALSTRPATR